ncbi:MAG: T9SS type A sorting domain-containing protein [Saprospiraceae bacterium]|jgi:uncharacterized repeat protein (TIGR01451 family)|nr:T9SS type A sorting domain-containing protein [Saprospiraceae bacterium]
MKKSFSTLITILCFIFLSKATIIAQDTVSFTPVLNIQGDTVEVNLVVQKYTNISYSSLKLYYDTSTLHYEYSQFIDYPLNFFYSKDGGTFNYPNYLSISHYDTSNLPIVPSVPNGQPYCIAKFTKKIQTNEYCVKPNYTSTYNINQLIPSIGINSCFETPIDTCIFYIEANLNGDTLTGHLKSINFKDIFNYNGIFLEFDKSNLKFLGRERIPYNGAFFDTIHYNSGFYNIDSLVLFNWSNNRPFLGSMSNGSDIVRFKFLLLGTNNIICFKRGLKSSNQYPFVTTLQHNIPIQVPTKIIDYCETFDYSTVTGTIYQDENSNCNFDSETNIGPFVSIKFDNGSTPVFAQTNDNGKYKKFLPPGTYDVSTIAPNQYWSNCNTIGSITITNNNDSINKNDLLSPIINCPALNVNINATRMRLCLPMVYTIDYINNGTEDAMNAYVIVKLPATVSFTSSSIPAISLGNNEYRFNLGNIDVFYFGQFTIEVLVNCDPSLISTTQCVEANIFPDTLCNPDPSINLAELSIKSSCVSQIAKFEITNTGKEDMTTELDYTTIEDDLMPGIIGKLKLNKGGSKIIDVPANGKTIRLWFDTIPNAPYKINFTRAIEGCGTRPDGTISTGFVNQFALGDQSPYYDMQCNLVFASCDPNEKEASPTGYTTENIINKETKIDYSVHFQNTGNDTAFRVVITDTISHDLDLSTLSIHSASHPFNWNIEKGRILKFTFLPIQLVDSFANEKASRGYVNYSIMPKNDLPLGTQIKNTANIYFDFNPAVVTNTYIHTIGKPVISAVFHYKHPSYSVKAYPNPFSDQITFELDKNQSNFKLELLDLFGRTIFTQHESTNILALKQINIPLQGMFIFKIYNNKKELISQGGLIRN